MSDELKEEIIHRAEMALEDLYIDCPECECMDQYQCGTCGGTGELNVKYLLVTKYLLI